MPRFADMLLQGVKARGHEIQVWKPTACFYRLPSPASAKKWLGYLDQYLVFPLQVRVRLRKTDERTLFVFADQALGPWVPLVADRPHVIYVHDLMALQSALGEFKENPTSWTGRQYQAMIRRGFARGQHFISVSENTRADLQRFLAGSQRSSEVVYNGLNYAFRPMSRADCVAALADAGLSLPQGGYLLHVGGNQWYKNRAGVLEAYEVYARKAAAPLPLWMVGAPPDEALRAAAQRLDSEERIRFLTGLSGDQLCAAYSSARLLLFPSLAEGFGWPIAEAMACGCLVLTTDEAPMTEVGGEAAYYLPRRPDVDSGGWARTAADRIMQILALPAEEHAEQRRIGLARSAEFDADRALDAYERIYLRVLEGALD
jgi:glycosyltransferase involved in cell wall biosynthesis